MTIVVFKMITSVFKGIECFILYLSIHIYAVGFKNVNMKIAISSRDSGSYWRKNTLIHPVVSNNAYLKADTIQDACPFEAGTGNLKRSYSGCRKVPDKKHHGKSGHEKIMKPVINIVLVPACSGPGCHGLAGNGLTTFSLSR